MWVHDATGTLLVVGTWLFCSAAGGVLSSYVDGERQPLRNALVLLGLGYPIAVTQTLRGVIVAPVLLGGITTAVAIYYWHRRHAR